MARVRLDAEELLRRYELGERDFKSVDLDGVDLRGKSFMDISFAGATLRGTNFTLTELRRVDFTEADLQGAGLAVSFLDGSCFRSADLRTAILIGALIRDVDLTDATLLRSGLRNAVITRATLVNTDFRLATCGDTIWADVDLSCAKNIERIDHVGPSSVGLGTMLLSRGHIPDKFLRDSGVPEHVIALQKTLALGGSPIEFYSCFVSFSSVDEDFARRLHGRLQQEGLRVWFAPEDMKGGRKLHEQIDDAIRVHDKLLLVLSEASMKSEWVATEISKARKRERKEGKQVLFPVRLVDFEAIKEWECFDADAAKDSAREVREYFIPDFSNWKDHESFEGAFTRLVRGLKASAE